MTGDESPDGPAVSPSRRAADRIGAHFKRTWSNYLDHWQEWIVPTLIAGAIALAALFCCCLPHLLVVGPLGCGLYWCAFEALEGRMVRADLLVRGMETAGRSIPAMLFIILINLLPVLLLYGAFMLLIFAITIAAGPPGAAQQEPPPAFIAAMMVFYLGMFPAIFVIWIWQLWFSTRMMFVLPLIAHRRLGISESLSASWRETKTSFWELLALNLAAQMIAGLGAYFMYVGMLFTVPFAVTLLASVYLDRFGDDGATAGHSHGSSPDLTAPPQTPPA